MSSRANVALQLSVVRYSGVKYIFYKFALWTNVYIHFFILIQNKCVNCYYILH